MTTDRQDLIRRKANLRAHLSDVRCYLGRLVDERELVSVAESRQLIATAREIFERDGRKRVSFDLPFPEKSTPRFLAFVGRIAGAGASGAYLWTARSDACGLCRLDSVRDIDWSFDFGCDPTEMFVLYSSDLSDSLLVEYFESDEGQQQLRLELSGHRWSDVDGPR